jgi:hypothetical protein
MHKLADGSWSDEYKVCDEFEVVVSGTFKVGEVVRLTEDDDTECPFFQSLSSGEEQVKHWSGLKPYNKVSNKMKDTQDKIDVMQAYVDGEEIELGSLASGGWTVYVGESCPTWNFRYFDYRIKPKVKEMTLVEIEEQLGHPVKLKFSPN